MLVKCTECGKEISDKAISCPNCGCPISQMNFENYCAINGIMYDFNDIVELIPKIGDKPTDVDPIYIVGSISRKTNLAWNYSKQLADIIINTNKIPKTFNGELKEIILSNTPKCPTCGSTNIQKIGTGERVASVTMLGLFSKKINKSYKCLNCKHTW